MDAINNMTMTCEQIDATTHTKAAATNYDAFVACRLAKDPTRSYYGEDSISAGLDKGTYILENNRVLLNVIVPETADFCKVLCVSIKDRVTGKEHIIRDYVIHSTNMNSQSFIIQPQTYYASGCGIILIIPKPSVPFKLQIKCRDYHHINFHNQRTTINMTYTMPARDYIKQFCCYNTSIGLYSINSGTKTTCDLSLVPFDTITSIKLISSEINELLIYIGGYRFHTDVSRIGNIHIIKTSIPVNKLVFHPPLLIATSKGGFTKALEIHVDGHNKMQVFRKKINGLGVYGFPYNPDWLLLDGCAFCEWSS